MKKQKWLLILGGVIVIFVTKLFGYILPLVLRDNGYSFVEISGLFTISMLLFQIIKIILAKISDYSGRKIFFIASKIFGILTNALPLIQMKYLVLLIANFLNNLTYEIWNMVYVPVVLDNMSKKQMARVYNKWQVTPTLISGICIIAFLLVFSSFDFDTILTINIALLSVATILTLRLKLSHKKPKKRSFSLKSLFTIKHNFIKRLVVFSFFNGMRVAAGWIFLMPLLIKTVHGFDNNLTIVFIMCFEVLWACFTFFSSRLNEVDHIKYPVMGLSLVAMVSVLSYFVYDNLAFLAFLFALQSFGSSFLVSSQGKIMKQHIGKESARESSLIAISLFAGQAFGFLIAGPIATLFALQSLFILRAGITVILVYIYAGFSKRLFREYFI